MNPASRRKPTPLRVAALRRIGFHGRRVVLALAGLVGGCASVGDLARPDVDARYTYRLLGTQAFAHRLVFGGTTVGGLSGIDRDPRSGRYYLISDDRAEFAPNRFYTASLAIDEQGFHDAKLESVVALLAPDGRPYAPQTADSEAIRYDPRTGTLWWTSEGARKPASATRGEPWLVDPFVRQSTPAGEPLAEVPLDPMFRVGTTARGTRDNLSFEGLTLSADGEALWVAMEGPLLQDGPRATASTGAWARFSRHPRRADGSFGALDLQVAYPVDPVPTSGAWITAFAQTGVSEILALDASRFLVIERAYAIGAGWRIRLFEADVADATDVHAIDSLVAPGVTFVPVAKRLSLDFATLGIRIDNLEGVSFGPTLANGHRTLVFVADDNFNAAQTTQLLALEMIPR